MPPPVTIPLFALRKGHTSGLESAIFNLLRGLLAAGSQVRLAGTRRASLPEPIARWIEEHDIPFRSYPGFGRAMSARFAEESVFGLLSDARQVLSPNYFLPPRGPRLGRRAVIIHDLQHKVFPEHFGPRKARWLDRQFARTLRRADLTVFISHFELEQARRYLGAHVDERRVAVVPNAVDWGRFDGGAVAPSIRAAAQGRYVVSVAQDFPHKRLRLLIRAFRHVAAADAEVRLLLVGRPSEAIMDFARRELDGPTAERVRFLGFVSDAELACLYARAALFALPSAYEGFGMPAVEALGLGCPALVTDTAALPEVTLGRARYVPLSADAPAWAERILAMLGSAAPPDRALRDEIRARYDPLRIARLMQAALADQGRLL